MKIEKCPVAKNVDVISILGQYFSTCYKMANVLWSSVQLLQIARYSQISYVPVRWKTQYYHVCSILIVIVIKLVERAEFVTQALRVKLLILNIWIGLAPQFWSDNLRIYLLLNLLMRNHVWWRKKSKPSIDLSSPSRSFTAISNFSVEPEPTIYSIFGIRFKHEHEPGVILESTLIGLGRLWLGSIVFFHPNFF